MQHVQSLYCRMLLLSMLTGFWGFMPNVAIQAQDFCSTLPGRGAVGALPAAADGSTTGPYYIRIYVHALGDDNGNGKPSDAQIFESINIMRSSFTSHNIFFVWDCDILDIHNSYLYNYNVLGFPCNAGQFYTSHADGIDIIIGGDNAPAFGAASGVPGKMFIVKGTSYAIPSSQQGLYVMARSHVIGHEMGHCLGLYHTFESGSSFVLCGVPFNPGGCPECVDGSNSATCGDYVTDTPADPGFGTVNAFLSNCVYYWNNLDACNNEPYHPNTHLIMSYTYPGCMTHHTPGQGERMRNMIATSPILQPTVTTPQPILDCGHTDPCTPSPIVVDHDCRQTAEGNWFDHITLLYQGSPIAMYNDPNCCVTWEYLSGIPTLPCPRKNGMDINYTPMNIAQGRRYKVTIVCKDCTYTESGTIDCPNGNRAGERSNETGQGVWDETAVSVFPNPVKNEIAIQVKSIGPSETVVFQVFDMYGRLYLNHALAPTDQMQVFDVADLPPGIYAWRVLNPGQKTVREGKVVKAP